MKLYTLSALKEDVQNSFKERSSEQTTEQENLQPGGPRRLYTISALKEDVQNSFKERSSEVTSQ